MLTWLRTVLIASVRRFAGDVTLDVLGPNAIERLAGEERRDVVAEIRGDGKPMGLRRPFSSSRWQNSSPACSIVTRSAPGRVRRVELAHAPQRRSACALVSPSARPSVRTSPTLRCTRRPSGPYQEPIHDRRRRAASRSHTHAASYRSMCSSWRCRRGSRRVQPGDGRAGSPGAGDGNHYEALGATWLYRPRECVTSFAGRTTRQPWHALPSADRLGEPDPERARGRGARRGGAHQPCDRRAALHLAAHGQQPSPPRLSEARRVNTRRPGRQAASNPRTRLSVRRKFT